MRREAEAQNTGKAGRPGGGHDMRAGTRHKKDAGLEKQKLYHV